MKRQAGTVIVAMTMSLAVCPRSVLASGTEHGLTKLIANADAIVAVEILRTDYTATAADGPMYGEAKVLKMIKGPLAENSALRFGESGWWGPTYQTGERRILFLQRVTSTEYYASARWATLFADGIEFFFSSDSLEALSSVSLTTFLEGVQEARRTPPKIQVAHQADSVSLASVTLINDSDQAIWMNWRRVTASFEANKIAYSRDVKFAAGGQAAWIRIAPAGSITGTVRIARREVKGTSRFALSVSHRSVNFPNRGWVGTVSAMVQLVD